MHSPEITFRTIRWNVAFHILTTRGIDTDNELLKNDLNHVADKFISIINMCNHALGLPFIKEGEKHLNKPFEQILEDEQFSIGELLATPELINYKFAQDKKNK